MPRHTTRDARGRFTKAAAREDDHGDYYPPGPAAAGG